MGRVWLDVLLVIKGNYVKHVSTFIWIENSYNISYTFRNHFSHILWHWCSFKQFLNKTITEYSINSTACTRGSYGIHCNETCGHCFNGSQCSSINGSCPRGCDSGYTGDLCTTSKYRGPVTTSKKIGHLHVQLLG